MKPQVLILSILALAGAWFPRPPIESPGATLEVTLALADETALNQITADYDLVEVELLFVASIGLPATYRARVPGADWDQLRQDHRLVYAEPDETLWAAEIVRNDPLFTTDQFQEAEQWYLPKVKVPQAWEISEGNSDVVVAVVDTGIHAAHIELNDGRVVEGYNTITNAAIPPSSNSDDNGHGTAVAGVIGAISDNGRGVAGINKYVRLMPLKALHADGTGNVSAVAAAIVWAADHGAAIVNLSLGGPGFGADQTLNNAITYAYNKGVLIVSAAGNDLAEHGQNLDTSPVYPICSDNGANMVVGVAATDITDRKADFSNFGINCIDLSAPGKKILTTAYFPSDPANNVLIYGSGTSLATPVVSGIAALIKAHSPALSHTQLRSVLHAATDNIDALNQDNCLNSSCNGFLGKGRINALKAFVGSPIPDGGLVKNLGTGQIFSITGNIKRLVSDFVLTQRGFSQSAVVDDTANQLANFAQGDPLPPLDGTLIKSQSNPTVYMTHQGLLRPFTYLVFVSRGLNFANVAILPDAEVAGYKQGDWYWPPDGTMVLIEGNSTVYVMHQETRRPVTYFVFTQRGLSFSRVVKVTADEFSHIPAPADAYWLPPLDGTLVKSSSDPTVFVIEQGAKQALSLAAFQARGYKFGNIKILPQAEMDVIAPGTPIL